MSELEEQLQTYATWLANAADQHAANLPTQERAVGGSGPEIQVKPASKQVSKFRSTSWAFVAAAAAVVTLVAGLVVTQSARDSSSTQSATTPQTSIEPSPEQSSSTTSETTPVTAVPSGSPGGPLHEVFLPRLVDAMTDLGYTSVGGDYSIASSFSEGFENDEGRYVQVDGIAGAVDPPGDAETVENADGSLSVTYGDLFGVWIVCGDVGLSIRSMTDDGMADLSTGLTERLACATPAPTSESPLVATFEPCTEAATAEQAAFEFYEAMRIARTIDSFAHVDGCLDAVPDAFSGIAPNCWTPCETASRQFLTATFRTGEVFDIDQTVRQSSSAAVSYLTLGGDRIDVIETWSMTPTDDGFAVDGFTIDEVFLSRADSASTIAEYFDHVANGNWEAAAAMLDDGALNLDERPDLNRLNPDTFTIRDIAIALAEWCELGCNTQPPTPDELTFDGLYGYERDGQPVRAAWFEGLYSISGLPIRTSGALAAQFDQVAILADDIVTQEEYRIMFAFLADCAVEAGATSTLSSPDFDELDQRFVYSINGDSIVPFDSCYATHGQTIDVRFQVDPDRVARRAANYEIVARCLDAAGIDFRAYAQQSLGDRPADFPAIDQLTKDELIDIGLPNAIDDDAGNAPVMRACRTI